MAKATPTTAKASTPPAEQPKQETTATTQASSTETSKPASTATAPEQLTGGDPAAVVTDTAEQTKPDTGDQASQDKAVEEAIAPAIQGREEDPVIKSRMEQTLGDAGGTPPPTMVNGVYVGDKTYNDKTGKYETDPEKAAATRRAADIFDRIGEAFPHERQRLVVEEIARAAGLSNKSLDLPDGMPAVKSTASLRTDVSGHGRFTGGGPGVAPVEVGKDGTAQVDTPAKSE